MVIKRIGVASVGKVCGILYAGLGFIVGAIFSMFAVFGAALGAAGNDGPGAAFGIIFGLGAIILLPVFYGVMGALGGMLMAALYNVVASFVGGIELDVDTPPTAG